MANFKVVLQFTQPSRGWEEVYYKEASTLADAARFQGQIMWSCLAFRSKLTVLNKVTFSDVENNRVSSILRKNYSQTDSAGSPDVASTSAVYTLNAPSTGGKRSVWFRGLRDEDVLRSGVTGVDAPSAFLRNGVQSFIVQLTAENYMIRSLMPLTVAPMIYSSILAVTVGAPGIVTLNVPSTWTATTSNRIIVSQVDNKLFPGLNGHWAIQSSTGTTIVLPYRSHLPSGVYPMTKARTRPEEYQYGRISDVLFGFNKFGSRDTGKNPLGGRGRRSPLIRRSA